MSRIDAAAQRRHKLRNAAQALLLLGGMFGMAGVAAFVLAGPVGVLWVAAAIAFVLLLRPKIPTAWVLRAYGAQRLPERVAPELHGLVGGLAARAGLPHPPHLYYVPTSMLNAFAVGRRDDAAIGITDGLLRQLTGRELAGVLAHEISHISNDDLWIMTLADTVGRFTHALAYVGLLLLLVGLPLLAAGSAAVLLVAVVLTAVPTVVTLLQLALSRTREYDADLEAARLTGDPVGLARALRTLEHHEGRIWERILVPHRRSPDPLLLRTHPPTEERVRRLAELVPLEEGRLVLRDVPLAPAGYTRVSSPTRLRPPGVWW